MAGATAPAFFLELGLAARGGDAYSVVVAGCRAISGRIYAMGGGNGTTLPTNQVYPPRAARRRWRRSGASARGRLVCPGIQV